MNGSGATTRPAGLWMVLYWLVLALLALRFCDLYYNPSFELPEATLSRLLAGEALTPFQYRALSVWILRLLIDVGLPSGLAVMLLAWASLMTTLLLLERLGVAVGLDHRFNMLAVALAFYPLTNLFIALEYLRFWYPWDLPQIALVAAAWLCLLRDRPLLYGLVFLAATVNRETSFFCAFLFLAVYWDRWPKRHLLGAVALQAAVWFAIKTALARLYAENEGVGLAAFKLLDNLDALVQQPLDALLLLAQFGGAWLPLILFWRRIPDLAVRRSLLAVPPFLAMLLVVANIYEVRVLGELLPPVWVAASLLLSAWLGLAPAGRRDQSEENPASDSPTMSEGGVSSG